MYIIIIVVVATLIMIIVYMLTVVVVRFHEPAAKSLGGHRTLSPPAAYNPL